MKKPIITICYSTNFHKVRESGQGIDPHRKMRIHNEEGHHSIIVSEEHIISEKVPVTEREFKILQQTWKREDSLNSTIHLPQNEGDNELLIIRPAQ